MNQPENPFLKNRKIGPPYNVKHPFAGVVFILLLIGVVIGFWLGRISVKLIGP